MVPIIQAFLATVCTVIAVTDPTPFKIGCAIFTGLMFVFSLSVEVTR